MSAAPSSISSPMSRSVRSREIASVPRASNPSSAPERPVASSARHGRKSYRSWRIKSSKRCGSKSSRCKGPMVRVVANQSRLIRFNLAAVSVHIASARLRVRSRSSAVLKNIPSLILTDLIPSSSAALCSVPGQRGSHRPLPGSWFLRLVAKRTVNSANRRSRSSAHSFRIPSWAGSLSKSTLLVNPMASSVFQFVSTVFAKLEIVRQAAKEETISWSHVLGSALQYRVQFVPVR